MYSGEKTIRSILKLQNCILYVLKYRDLKSYNKPVDGEVLAIIILQKEKRENRLRIQLQLWTLKENGAFVWSTEMKQIDINLLGQDSENSHTQRGKNKVATMLRNRKETELISENNRKKLNLTAFIKMHRKHDQVWFW